MIIKIRKAGSMITSVRNINFTRCNTVAQNYKNNNAIYSKPAQTQSCDSVSFTGKVPKIKLSTESTELIREFAQKLQLNKLYKFDKPDVQTFHVTAIASKNHPENRILYVQYSGYTKDNMTKHVNCAISNSGQIFEDNQLTNKVKDVAAYEEIIPELINYATKELKVS